MIYEKTFIEFSSSDQNKLADIRCLLSKKKNWCDKVIVQTMYIDEY